MGRCLDIAKRVMKEWSRPPLTEVQTRQLSAAPPADVMSEEPCALCGSHERWRWLDGRLLCRVCLVLDLASLTLKRVTP
jgi:hypothetical protein